MKFGFKKWLMLGVLLGSSGLALASQDCVGLLAKLADQISQFALREPMGLGLDVNLLRPTAKRLMALKKNPKAGRLYYAIAEGGGPNGADQLFLSESPIHLDDYRKTFAAVSVGDPPVDPPMPVPLREAGEVKFVEEESSRFMRLLTLGRSSRQKSGFVFEPTSGVVSADQELTELTKIDPALREVEGEHVFLRADRPGISPTRMMKCSDILDKHTQGKRFLIDSLTSNFGYGVAAILVTAPERFYEAENHRLVVADLGATQMNTLLRTWLTYGSISRGDPLMKRYGIRALSLPMSISVQTLVYKGLDISDVRDIWTYLMGYSLVMIPKNDLLDRILIEHLPRLSYEQCLTNSGWRFFINSHTFRIADRLGSTVLFYFGRQTFQGR
ncbi:MAG: hypothetical protein ACK5QT_09285 [Oligoflexia bacterium]